MNKFILSFLSFVLLISFCSCSQSEETESKIYHNLNGKVKSVTERWYAIIDFDKEFIGDNLYYYDSYNVADYDEAGRLVEERHFSNDELFVKVVPTRNWKKKLTGQIIYNGDGKVQEKVKIVSSSKDKMQLESYDADDIKILSTTILKEGKTETSIGELYGYREKGEYKNKNDRYYVVGSQVAVQEYDDNGNIISSGTTVSIDYDLIEQEEGMVAVEEIIYDDDDDEGGEGEDKQYYEYIEFDSQNNWTQRLIYKRGEVEGLLVREIQYYE